MLKAIIIDDEADAINNMQILLQRYCENIEVVGCASSLMDGVKLLNTFNTDIVFLDIELSSDTGFDLLEFFPSRTFHVVLVTAYDSYTLKAIKSRAYDYLLKPVNVEELKKVVDDIYELQQRQISAKPSESLKEKQLFKLPIYANEGIVYITLKDVIHIKAEGSYSIVYLKNDKPITVSKGLIEFDKPLSSRGFYRAHKSHLINIKYVERFNRGTGVVVMSDNSEIELSRSRKDEFLQIMESNSVLF
jgi:two-component system LytT family response regulator